MDRFREQEQLAFLRTGIIASVIANCNRDAEKVPQAYTPQDFMPAAFKPAEQTPEMTDEQREKAWLDEMRVLCAMTGGEDTTLGAR